MKNNVYEELMTRGKYLYNAKGERRDIKLYFFTEKNILNRISLMLTVVISGG